MYLELDGSTVSRAPTKVQTPTKVVLLNFVANHSGMAIRFHLLKYAFSCIQFLDIGLV